MGAWRLKLSFIPSVHPGSNSESISGEQRAGSCGREGTLDWALGAHQEELLLGNHTGFEISTTGGLFFLPLSMKWKERITQVVAFN